MESEKASSFKGSRISDHDNETASRHEEQHNQDVGKSPADERIRQTRKALANKFDTSKLPRLVQDLLWLAKDQWFLIVMGILIAIASQVQVPPAQQERKTSIVNYLAVSLIFFLNGCAIPTSLLVENLMRWKIHLFVQLQSYLVTSATAFGIMSLTALNRDFLNEDLLVGVIVTGCLPTAIAFNVIVTRKAEGNSALTLTQSALGNCLGPFLSTALVRMYLSVDTWYTNSLPTDRGVSGELYRQVFKQLGLSVFVPIVAGQIVVNIFPDITKKVLFKYKAAKLGSFALLTLIWQTYDEAFASNAFAGVPDSNIAFVVFITIAIFFLWFVIAMGFSLLWLPPEDVIAVAFTVATKTPAIGLPLTGILFQGLDPASLARIRIEMVFYQALQAACSSLLTIPLRRWKGVKDH